MVYILFTNLQGFDTNLELAFVPYILFNLLQFKMHTKGVNGINAAYSLHMKGHNHLERDSIHICHLTPNTSFSMQWRCLRNCCYDCFFSDDDKKILKNKLLY